MWLTREKFHESRTKNQADTGNVDGKYIKENQKIWTNCRSMSNFNWELELLVKCNYRIDWLKGLKNKNRLHMIKSIVGDAMILQ